MLRAAREKRDFINKKPDMLDNKKCYGKQTRRVEKEMCVCVWGGDFFLFLSPTVCDMITKSVTFHLLHISPFLNHHLQIHGATLIHMSIQQAYLCPSHCANSFIHSPHSCRRKLLKLKSLLFAAIVQHHRFLKARTLKSPS